MSSPITRDVAAPSRATPLAPPSATPTARCGGWTFSLAGEDALWALMAEAEGHGRTVHDVLPGDLSSWTSAARRLLALDPANEPDGCVTLRTPWLLDRDRRPVLALHGASGMGAVVFALETSGPDGTRVSGAMSAAELAELVKLLTPELGTRE